MRIHCFQHVPYEGPGCIAQWAEANGHAMSSTRFYGNDPLPLLDGFDWLVVMGGPMNIYEEAEYPWLVAEKMFIRDAIQRGKIVLGVCLGAQLLADALEAKVTANPCKEIGWFPIAPTFEARGSRLFDFLPEKLTAFHWHGDTFGLPKGAVHTVRSEACEHQAFAFGGRAAGLQFHLEFTRACLDAILSNCQGELVSAPFIQTADEMLRNCAHFPAMNEAMFCLLDRLAAEQG